MKALTEIRAELRDLKLVVGEMQASIESKRTSGNTSVCSAASSRSVRVPATGEDCPANFHNEGNRKSFTKSSSGCVNEETFTAWLSHVDACWTWNKQEVGRCFANAVTQNQQRLNIC